MRAYCFSDPHEASTSERLTVVHVHTLTAWVGPTLEPL